MASFSGFDPAALDFLRDLGEHNDRAWFEAHRADYEGLLLAAGARAGRRARRAAGRDRARRPRRPARERLDPAHQPRHPLLDRQAPVQDPPRPVALGGRRAEPRLLGLLPAASRPTGSATAPACTISRRTMLAAYRARRRRSQARAGARAGGEEGDGVGRPGRPRAVEAGARAVRRRPSPGRSLALRRDGRRDAGRRARRALHGRVPGRGASSGSGRCGRSRSGWLRWWRTPGRPPPCGAPTT